MLFVKYWFVWISENDALLGKHWTIKSWVFPVQLTVICSCMWGLREDATLQWNSTSDEDPPWTEIKLQKIYIYKLSTGTRIIHELTFKELLKLKCFSGKQQVWCEVRLHVWVWGSRVWCISPVRAPSSEHSWGVKAGGGQIALYKLEVSSSARTFWWGTARNLHVHILE